jgi:hypothetical protein
LARTQVGVLRAGGLNTGVMLLPQPDNSLLVAKKQTNLENLYPSTAEYDSAPVYRERTFQFRPTGGLGEPTQASATSRRYHYGINVWVTGGLFGKGPAVHAINPAGMAVTPAVATMHRKFLEFQGALVYLTNGKVMTRLGDSSAAQGDLRVRAGHYPTDAIVFRGAYAGATTCLYVAWEDGVLEEYTGSAWSTCTLPAGFAVSFLEVVGDELWGAYSGGSIVRKVTADPKVAANWGGAINIGTPTTVITALRQTNNRLTIFKADGRLFTVNTDGSDNDLFPGLLTTPDNDNGRTAVAWLGSLWFRSSRAWYELTYDPVPALTPRGPGRNLGNLSEVRGPVQAFSGWNTQMAFAGIYNSELNASYLLSYGSWVPKADPGSAGTTVSGTGYTFLDQYDGAIRKWAGRQITSLFVSNVPSEARLYCGFLDGGYDWIKLVPFPLLPGQGAEYTLDESYIVLPLHHAMFQSDDKHWTGVSAFGPMFGVGNEVELEYRIMGRAAGSGTGPGGTWLPWGERLQANGGRANPEQAVAGKGLELRANFLNVGVDTTPVLEGLGLHERLVPTFRRDWTFTVNANDYIARRDGASTRQSGRTIRQWVEDAASAPASVSVELPDETLSNAAIFAYEEHQTPHTERGGQGWAITVQATQFFVVTIYGIIDRLSGVLIDDLAGYTIDDLEFF